MLRRLPFQAIHAALLPQVDLVVQVHGFAAAGHPGFTADVVVSAGPGEAASVQSLAEALTDAGLVVCVPDGTGTCDALAGRTNLQGVTAVAAGLAFVHLEVAESVRSDQARRMLLVDAVAALQAGS